MKAFAKPGRENSQEAIEIAVRVAKEKGLDILMASTRGLSVPLVLDEAKKQGYTGKITAVAHAYGYGDRNTFEIADDYKKELEDKGVRFVIGTHALSAGERGMSRVFKGMYPLEIVATTLRMFGQGMKVCCEIAVMAADQGAVKEAEPIMCLAGTAGGEDTVAIVTPATSNRLLEMKVNEVLAKPSLYVPVVEDK